MTNARWDGLRLVYGTTLGGRKESMDLVLSHRQERYLQHRHAVGVSSKIC